MIWPSCHPTTVVVVALETRSTAGTDRNEKRAVGNFFKLAGFAHSLGKVPVLVSVTRPANKQRVNEIIKLGPGSIYQVRVSPVTNLWS
jgi:hypothetical protein